jgi:hypothetical protein
MPAPPAGHVTFVAGILAARRGCTAPAICCNLLVRPIFSEAAVPGELARVERALKEALERPRGMIVVAAAALCRANARRFVHRQARFGQWHVAASTAPSAS